MSASQVYLRPASRSDLPELLPLDVASMITTEIYPILLPGAVEHPAQNAHLAALRFRTRMVGSTIRYTVAHDATGHVLGYCCVEVIGDCALARAWGAEAPWWWSIERTLLSLQDKYDHWVGGARSVLDENVRTQFVEAQAPLDKASQPCLHVHNLVVAVGAQRRGIGAKLLNHVLQLATGEKLDVCLVSLKTGRGLYDKMGFTVVDVLQLERGNEVLDLPFMIRKAEKSG